MILYFIRHGHRADLEPGYTGGGNPPLSEKGHRQVDLMAEAMADKNLCAIYSSSQLRALQTAEPLHRRIGGDWHVWPCLCETNPKAWDEVYALEPDQALEMVAWQTGEELPVPTPEELAEKDGDYYLLSDIPKRFPGTSLTQPFRWPVAWWKALSPNCRETGYARLELGLRAILSRHKDGDEIAILGHGNATDMCITILMNLPRDNMRRMGTANASISRIDIRPDGQRILNYANRVDHIPMEMRS